MRLLQIGSENDARATPAGVSGQLDQAGWGACPSAPSSTLDGRSGRKPRPVASKGQERRRVLLAAVAGVSPAYTRGVRECYGRRHVCLLSNPLSDARLSRDNAVTAQRRGDVTCVLSLRAVCESWERNACNQPSLRTALFWCPPPVP